MNEKKYIGYLKYSGYKVSEGYFDARKSAQALLGFDEAVRFFVGAQNSDLRNVDFELPVTIKHSSWEMLLPIVKYGGTALAIGGAAYLATAGKKMAERDFKDFGLKDVFRKSLEGIQWLIRIGKHLGRLDLKKFENVKFKNENKEIGLPNSSGEILYVPTYYYDLFQLSNPNILSKNAELIDDNMLLTVGVFNDEGEVKEEPIPKNFRYVFTREDSDIEGIVFPELQHGQIVSLKGDVTRGNETTNSIGFRYKGLILSCEPEKGSIVEHKRVLFEEAIIHGTISRFNQFGKIAAKKPKIIFSDIQPLKNNTSQSSLFKDG